MGTDNPMNPYTNDEEETRRAVAPPIAKAKVVEVYPTDEESGDLGYHTVRVRVYGEDSTFQAPVLTPMFGDANLPPVDTDVAVAYGPNEKPWVVGAWYRANGDGPPDHQAGERIIGHPLTGSSIKFDANGDIVLDAERDVIGASGFSGDHADLTNVQRDQHHTRYSNEEAQDTVASLLNGGSNVSTTYNDGADTLTIDTSALNQEEVEDTVASLFSAGDNLTAFYDDANSNYTLNVTDNWVDESGDTMSGTLDMGFNQIVDTNSITYRQSSTEDSFRIDPEATSMRVLAESGAGEVQRWFSNGQTRINGTDDTALLVESSTVSGGEAFPTDQTWAAEIHNREDVENAGGLIVSNRYFNSNTDVLRVGNSYDSGTGFNNFLVVDGRGNVDIPNGKITESGNDVVSSPDGDYDIQKNGTDGAGVINFKT